MKRDLGTLTAAIVIAAASACGGSSSTSATATHSPAGTPSTAASTSSAGLPSGELIAFERLVPGSEDRDLYVVPATGGEPAFVRHQVNNPHWSADGKQLAFLTCLNPPDCTTAVALLDRTTGEVHGFPMPDPDLYTPCALWAPSGQVLACEGQSEADPKRNGVYTLSATDGKTLTRITKNPSGTDSPVTYSADGAQLLFARTDPSRPKDTNQAFFVARIAGGEPKRITPWGYVDDEAGWSPDGRTIVFGTNGALYRVGSDGTGLAKIDLAAAPDGSRAVNAFDVSFAPDGKRIVFSLVTSKAPAASLYTALPDGTDVAVVTTGPTGDHHAAWGASR